MYGSWKYINRTGANIRSIGKGKQSTVIPDESITLEGFASEGGGYYLQSGEGVLRCELNGEYLKKFIYDFDSKDLVDAKITVGYDNSMGKEETITIEDKNPILLTRSVVNVGKRQSGFRSRCQILKADSLSEI